MGCSCSKDALEVHPELGASKGVSTTITNASRRLVGGPQTMRNASSPESPLAKKSHPQHNNAVETPSFSTPAKKSQDAAVVSSSSVVGDDPAASPSTPSTVPEEEDEGNDQEHPNSGFLEEGDDGAAAESQSTGTSAYLEDPSEHYESDAEYQRFSQVKDDIEQDLRHLTDLEQEVKLESRQLIQDLDSSASSSHQDQHLDDHGRRRRIPINVLLTGDDARYLMKLMRLAHGPPLTDDERGLYRDLIRSNVVDDVRVLCRHLRELDFESFLVFREEEGDEAAAAVVDSDVPDVFDSLQLFGQLRNAWQNIRTNGLAGPSYELGRSGSTDDSTGASRKPSGDGGKLMMTPRQAFEILVSVLLPEDDEDEDDPTKDENADLYEEEKEAIEDTKLFLNVWREIQALWESDELKEFLSERPWLLHDSLLFHLSAMEDLSRIAAVDYCATDEDVLDACDDDAIPTEHCLFQLERCDFNVSCFSLDYLDYLSQCGLQDVQRPHLVLFVSSLTGFDQTHGPDGVNKMTRSLRSLQTLRSSQLLHDSATCVILSKRDLFTEKMSYSDIAAIADFEDYEGDSGDEDDALTYFHGKFESFLATRTNDIVQLFDPNEGDVSTIFLDFSKRVQVPSAVIGDSRTRRRAEASNGSGKVISSVEKPTPSVNTTVTPEAESSQSSVLVKSTQVLSETQVSGDEFYTETIEV